MPIIKRDIRFGLLFYLPYYVARAGAQSSPSSTTTTTSSSSLSTPYHSLLTYLLSHGPQLPKPGVTQAFTLGPFGKYRSIHAKSIIQPMRHDAREFFPSGQQPHVSRGQECFHPVEHPQATNECDVHRLEDSKKGMHTIV